MPKRTKGRLMEQKVTGVGTPALVDGQAGFSVEVTFQSRPDDKEIAMGCSGS